MSVAKAVRAFTLGTALVLALPMSVAAQSSELQQWMNPTLGEAMPRAEYKLVYYPDERVEGQRTDLRWIEHSFNVWVPVAQDSENEWAVTGDTSYKRLNTGARMPDSHQRLPDQLWDVQFGGSYRHKFENGWIGGFGLYVESATDKPFASTDEVIPRGLAMLRIPRGERDAWIWSLFYARFQELVGGIPVPGLAYQYVPSDRFNAVIGAPFSSVEYKPVEPLTLEGQYFPLRRMRVRATYQVFRPLRAFAGFDIDNDAYFLADRFFKTDRLFYYEKRTTVGARFDLRHVGFQVRGGYAFDRYYFTGDDYSDRRHNRINVDPGPFISGGVAFRF